MNPTEKKKKRYKPAERVSLTPASFTLVSTLHSQIQTRLPDIKLNKSDLVNWLLKSRNDNFSDKEIVAIERDYFDPVKALEAAIAEARKQQEMGAPVDIQSLLSGKIPARKRCSPKLKSTRDRSNLNDQHAAKAPLD